jgi:hypothetical protein
MQILGIEFLILFYQIQAEKGYSRYHHLYDTKYTDMGLCIDWKLSDFPG